MLAHRLPGRLQTFGIEQPWPIRDRGQCECQVRKHLGRLVYCSRYFVLLSRPRGSGRRPRRVLVRQSDVTKASSLFIGEYRCYVRLRYLRVVTSSRKFLERRSSRVYLDFGLASRKATRLNKYLYRHTACLQYRSTNGILFKKGDAFP
jgi:hypothetical protein